MPAEEDGAHLRDALQAAIEKNNRGAAASTLAKLVVVEPKEPRWPHRLGETLVRLARPAEAERAFVQAANLYAAQGFLARAIAVAKLAVEINPARAELLAALDPEPARAIHRDNLPAASRRGARVSPAVAAHLLEPPGEGREDEIRFEDAPASCALEVQLIDFHPSMLPEPGAEYDAERTLDADKLSRMAGATLFADIPQEALAEMAHEAERVVLADGATIFAGGESADALLVIAEGRAEVRRPSAVSIELGEGEILGESSLLAGAIRSAEVRARQGFVALRLRKPSLDGLVARHPRVGDVLFGLLARRLVANAMETSPLFLPFDGATRAEIARAFEIRRARAGTVLQERGKKSDALYLVLSGTLDTHGEAGTERLVHGAIIGHRTLVSRGPAVRSVRVATEAMLLRLPAAKFTAFVTEFPPALAHLTELSANG